MEWYDKMHSELTRDRFDGGDDLQARTSSTCIRRSNNATPSSVLAASACLAPPACMFLIPPFLFFRVSGSPARSGSPLLPEIKRHKREVRRRDMASLPRGRSSTQTFTPTSIEVRKTRFTDDFSTTSCPMLNRPQESQVVHRHRNHGTAGVAAGGVAAQRSTYCISLPPKSVPSELASLGSVNSVYSDIDARTGLPAAGFSAEASLTRSGYLPRPPVRFP